MNDNIVNFPEQEKSIYGCPMCSTHFALAATDELACPQCGSTRLIHDNLHTLPTKYDLFICQCTGVYFKVARKKDGTIFVRCVKCGADTNTRAL